MSNHSYYFYDYEKIRYISDTKNNMTGKPDGKLIIFHFLRCRLIRKQ